jgi:TolB-like protein/DNA-binding winged helix-turn-helix (wHTH) protein
VIADTHSNDTTMPDTSLRVGDWHLDPQANTLTRDGGDPVRLEPKAVEVLVFLARRAGDVVAREDLLATVWPGVVVGDDALTQAIIKLRKALGDDARRPHYIETISKRGYRLVATVAADGVTPPQAPPAEPLASRGQRRLWASAAALLALMVSAVLWRGCGGDGLPATTDAARPIIAMLPLANQSGDPKRDYFGDGLTQDLINALGLYSGLRVIAHHSVEPYKTHPVDTRALKRELGARYIATGSVREADGRLRVTIELSDADNGVVLWSERYDGDGKEVFAFQDQIVRNVVGALAVKVTRLEEERAVTKPPGNLQAYDLVLRARALHGTSNRVANRQARALLAQALDLAPDYAEAYIVFASAEIQRSLDFGWTEDPVQSAERAEQYARRALALGSPGAQARAHGQLGVIYSALRQYEQAQAEVDLAVEINPSDAFALDTRGIVLLWRGHADEALASMDAALRFNPAGRGAGAAFTRALALYSLRRHADSLIACDAALARYPNTSFLQAMRAAALAQLGQVDAAHAATAETLRLEPFFHARAFGDRFVDPKLMAHLQEGLRLAGL